MKYVLSIVMFDKDINSINSLNTLDICSSREQALNYIDKHIRDLTSYFYEIEKKEKNVEKIVNDIINKIHSAFVNCDGLVSHTTVYNVLGEKIIFNTKLIEINLNTL